MIVVYVIYAYWPGMDVGSPPMHEGRGHFIITERFAVGYMMRLIGGDKTILGVAHELSSNAVVRRCRALRESFICFFLIARSRLGDGRHRAV